MQMSHAGEQGKGVEITWNATNCSTFDVDEMNSYHQAQRIHATKAFCMTG
jgi:hypothetical protein